MDKREAVGLAKDAATEAGWNLRKYKAPTADKDGAKWRVFFMGRSGRPGDHFSVVVSSRGKPRVIPGR